ncbi:hypothetical protein GT347_20050 [Xylophilus rhododendri]|uniref:DUF4224 domain-containing protein n=1 Tax=Xylophilus rhododendri TaxID=2697032 RepID=A0A857JBE5_9BURK|nr:DUF4224 domain-containing protein [Xylophilus rhododendri]QHJ00069.1 hypothetical protein GT347_20050 [Xylophilus rhododendri]
MSAQPLADEFLTPSEVKALADTANIDEQERILAADGIPFRRRGRRILVSRFHTREWLAGRAVTPSRGISLALVK